MLVLQAKNKKTNLSFYRRNLLEGACDISQGPISKFISYKNTQRINNLWVPGKASQKAYLLAR